MDYQTFKDSIEENCKVLIQADLSDEEKGKIARLLAYIRIQM